MIMAEFVLVSVSLTLTLTHATDDRNQQWRKTQELW